MQAETATTKETALPGAVEGGRGSAEKATRDSRELSRTHEKQKS